MAGLSGWIEEKMSSHCDGMTDEGATSQLRKIEVLVAITAAILAILGVSGSFRRCCANRAFAVVAFAAYTLMPVVIAYTLGLIQAPTCYIPFPIWATYLVVALENMDSYTAHRMEDIERWKSFNVDSALKFILTSGMIIFYAVVWNPIACILFVILFTKVDERARALMLASNYVMQKNYSFIADYMSTEHQRSDSSDEDPATMRGYRYLVRVADEVRVHPLFSIAAKWRQKVALWHDGDAPHYRHSLEVTNHVITVEKVWNCKGRLLSASGGDRDGRLKDLCLSFSLFKFICLRFTSYSLPQEAHNKLTRLIQHMLFEENGYERVFRVIEVELAFLFDLFYTKYPVNLHQCRSVYRLLMLPIRVTIPVLLLYFAIYKKWVQEAVVSALLMMSILVVELTQFSIMIFSEWTKVTYIYNYVRNERWQRNGCAEKLIEILCRVRLVKPWGRKLRQYSLLKSYSYSPPKWIYNRLTAAYLDQKGDGQKEIAPTNLSKQVKKAIAQSLRKDFTGYLEKGQASLRCNDLFHELSWACDLETTTHVILVWHVATTFCEHEVPCAQLSQEQRDNFDTATKLSQYLAYLVVFAPRLLPGHPCRTEYIFGRAVSEAKEKLGGSWISMEERIQKLKKGIDNKQCQETIVARGVQLGMQLVNAVAGERRIWKVLAYFWVDMMLYVAPSNDTAAHATYLTIGGEFVTHIWVLVSHMGIMRDPRGRELNLSSVYYIMPNQLYKMSICLRMFVYVCRSLFILHQL